MIEQRKIDYNQGFFDGYKKATEQANAVIEDIKSDIADFMDEIPTLGNCKEGWHNSGQKIGLEQACEIIDKHIREDGE